MNPTDTSAEYELLPPSGHAEQQQSLMGQEEQILKPEHRPGDFIGACIALSSIVLIAITTWVAIIANNLNSSWFALHPTLQTLSLVLFTYGIVTLQPTSQPPTKVAGLRRHQAAMLFVGLPAILLGTFAIAYNKSLGGKEHMTTWHGTLGYFCIVWILAQVGLGGGSVWFKGAAFGGGAKAKSLWKYHRLSGYILFPTLIFTAHLGGGWSSWGDHVMKSGLLRLGVYTVAPILTLIGVVVRIRTSKMNFFPK